MKARAIAMVAAALVVGAPAVSAFADPASHQQALDYFQRGGEAYRAGRFQEAIDLLEKAYDLEHDPTILYNIARSYEGLGDSEHAIDRYEQYLHDVKDIKDRAAIEARVASMKKSLEDKQRLEKERDDALKAQQAKDAGEKDAAAKATPATPAPRRSPSPVPWVLAGIGVAGIGAGAGLGVVALSKDDDAKKQTRGVDAASQHDDAKTLALGSTISFVAGGILAGVGITWGIVDVATRGPASTAEKKASVKLDVGPSHADVIVSF